MKTVKLKICGMNRNVIEVAQLQPDYLGFIFYEKSKRYFSDSIPTLPPGIKRVGVFVNASIEEVAEKLVQYDLDVIQLHGEESPKYCKKLASILSKNKIKLWKVFSIKDTFDFEVLKPFENVVNKFLFDTKGEEKGGNGLVFDWSVLMNYPSNKSFILSGGIGLEEVDALKKILKSSLPIYAIDVNSKFEIEPGLKDINALKKFKNEISC